MAEYGLKVKRKLGQSTSIKVSNKTKKFDILSWFDNNDFNEWAIIFCNISSRSQLIAQLEREIGEHFIQLQAQLPVLSDE